MVNFKILAGGSSSAIATYLFNSSIPSLQLLSQSPTGPNPTWLALNPANKSILYATNEVAVGGLQSFAVLASGALSSAPLSQISSGGDTPAFIAPLSTGQVAVFNYVSGNGRVIPTTHHGEQFVDAAPIITFPNVGSHPHMAVEYKDELFVPDLGGDKIWRLAQVGCSPGNWSIQGFIDQPVGSGPRHIAIRGDRLFTLHETASTLTLQIIPTAPTGLSSLLSNVSITPTDAPAGASWAAAEILIPQPTKDFPTPYIYVSNRNLANNDPRGDSIAIFEHITGADEHLELVAQAFTGLNQVRGMQVGPSKNGGEKYLVTAGVAGTAGVAIFERVDGGRGLQKISTNTEIETRSSFVWL